MMRARVVCVVLAAAVAAVLSSPLLAQAPAPQGPPPGSGGMNQPPKNLMILPKDFTREQVPRLIRGRPGGSIQVYF